MITGRSKQKIRSRIKRVLVEIQQAAQEAEGGGSPFDSAGSTDARFISAEGAYRHMMDDINWDQVDSLVQTINEREWKQEEYAKILAVMVSCASKIAMLA
jgi:hypothetical protein